MSAINILKSKFTSHLPWNQARLNLVSQFILALIKVRTVNLSEIANAFGGDAQQSSNYRRLQRFFATYQFDRADIARTIVHWMHIDKPWLLCLDRTNWDFGVVKVNILVLAVAYRGAAIPIVWCFLGKKGNSNTDERIVLLKRFLVLFSDKKIDCLTADREFRGKEWLQFLIDNGIRFRLRIPNNTQVSHRHKTGNLKVTRYFPIRHQEVMTLRGKRQVWGVDVYLSATRFNSEHVIVITGHNPESALVDYKKRWEIETLFGCLKTRGFNLESTHLCDMDRLCKLFSLVVLAFCWCYIAGLWLNERKPIPTKTHTRLAQSYFRYGLDYLRNILLNLHEKFKNFLVVADFLSCT